MKAHKTATPAEWLAQREALLEAEKAALREIDRVSRLRRELPWVRVEADYRFETEAGQKSLGDLFDGRSQLIVYHFMFAPGWEEGCHGCSFLSDHFDGANLHLAHHDVSLVAASRAPLEELLPYKQRMGWRFPWVSSAGSEFNFDYGVSFPADRVEDGKVVYNYQTTEQFMEEQPGLSVFAKDEAGDVWHTYSTYARGLDPLIGAHHLLDLTPLGRNEQGTMSWVRHHDRYEGAEPAGFPAPAAASVEKASEKGDGCGSCCSSEGSA